MQCSELEVQHDDFVFQGNVAFFPVSGRRTNPYNGTCSCGAKGEYVHIKDALEHIPFSGLDTNRLSAVVGIYIVGKYCVIDDDDKATIKNSGIDIEECETCGRWKYSDNTDNCDGCATVRLR